MLISKMHRAMRDDEAGQALILGALSMVILALSVMVTIQLGAAIDQRIQLQNAADNSSYSVAAAIARSLNFIAWVNRTQIAHYVSMMAFQSISSFLTGVQMLMWMLADLLQSISVIACAIAKICELCEPIPIVGVACAACNVAFTIISELASGAAEVLYGIVNSTFSAVDAIDSVVALAVKGISALTNAGMYAAAQGVRRLTQVFTGVTFMKGFQLKIMWDK
jgi:hypothetical protein